MSSQVWNFSKSLKGIITCCERISHFSNGFDREIILSDKIRYDAVLWTIHLIGWAVYSLPKTIYDLYPDIDWGFIMSLGYAIERTEVNWEIDSEAVCFFMEDVIPALNHVSKKMQLNSQLSSVEEEEMIELQEAPQME